MKIGLEDGLWDMIAPADVSIAPWKEFDIGLKTTMKTIYSTDGITIHFKTNETNLRAMVRNNNENVCEDSFMEFFLEAMIVAIILTLR